MFAASLDHTPAVKVHCGSAHVRGIARRYPYYVASLFHVALTTDGRAIYRNSGECVGPFRSQEKAARLGKELAEQHEATFCPGYGSLHNAPVSAVKLS